MRTNHRKISRKVETLNWAQMNRIASLLLRQTRKGNLQTKLRREYPGPVSVFNRATNSVLLLLRNRWLFQFLQKAAALLNTFSDM